MRGLPACLKCVERGTLLTGICSKCGKVSNQPNTSHCASCGFKRLGRRRVQRLDAQLNAAWSKELFQEFARDVGAEQDPSQAALLLERSIEGFCLLERAVGGPEQLSVKAVLEAFREDASRKRFRVIKNWLAATRGLDFDGPEADWWRHRDWVIRRISGEDVEWIRVQLDGLMDTLYDKRAKYQAAGVRRAATPIATKSLELALKYAQWFMRFCRDRFGVSDAIGIQQVHLDAYAAERPKVYQALGALIRRFNTTTHRMNKLILHSKHAARSSQHNRLEASARTQLIRALFAAEDATDLRNAAVALLAHFYAQRIGTVLALKRTAVREAEGGLMEVDFGRGFIEIDQAVAVIVRKWLAAWCAPSRFVTPENDDHLFPGIQPNRPYSRAAFGNWLRSRHKIYVRQLFATGVHGLLDAGLKDPGMLVYGFGMSPSTAIKYWRDSGRDVSSYLYEDAIELLRREGLLLGDVR